MGAPIAKYIEGAPIAKDLDRYHNLMVLIDGGGAYGIGDIGAHNAWGAYLKIYRGGAYRKVSGYIDIFL